MCVCVRVCVCVCVLVDLLSQEVVQSRGVETYVVVLFVVGPGGGVERVK